MGKGGGGSSNATQMAFENIGKLGSLGSGITRSSMRPMRELQFQQLEALRTGGVGAQIPVAQRSVEAQKQALSQTMRGLEGELQGGNLANSPFGQSIRAQTALAGKQAISNIPTDIAQQFIQGIPQTSLGGLQIGTGALGGSLTGAQNLASMGGGGKSGGGAAGGAVGGILAVVLAVI
jgi:hypothetical protein